MSLQTALKSVRFLHITLCLQRVLHFLVLRMEAVLHVFHTC